MLVANWGAWRAVQLEPGIRKATNGPRRHPRDGGKAAREGLTLFDCPFCRVNALPEQTVAHRHHRSASVHS